MKQETRKLLETARNHINDDTQDHREARSILWRVLHDTEEVEGI